MSDFIVMMSIVEEGKGSQVLKIASEIGVGGGTVAKGEGSVQSKFLNLLGLDSSRKEIALNVMRDTKEDYFYKLLSERLQVEKDHHGIVFSMPVKAVIGLRGHSDKLIRLENNKGEESMNAIFTIVDHGLAEDVIDEAKIYGAQGGTVIHARGSADHKETLFNFEIEPEKDIVLILSDNKKAKNISEAIANKFNFENEGTGIIFILDVSRSMGISKKNKL